MKRIVTGICLLPLALILASPVVAEDNKPAATATGVESITNGCTVISIGAAGLRLAGKGGACGNILEAMKPRLQATAFVKSNVTVRVQLTDESKVNMAYSEAAGRYVASVSGEATCEVLDNTTGRTIKQVRVPANGDLQSAEFYDRLTAQMVRRLSE